MSDLSRADLLALVAAHLLAPKKRRPQKAIDKAIEEAWRIVEGAQAGVLMKSKPNRGAPIVSSHSRKHPIAQRGTVAPRLALRTTAPGVLSLLSRPPAMVQAPVPGAFALQQGPLNL